MTRLLLLVGLVVPLLSGCGRHSTSVSVLQQYDELQPLFAAASTDSGRLSVDVRGLASNVAAARATSVRRSAVLLRRDALRMERAAAVSSSRLRPLRARDDDVPTHEYMDLVLKALVNQWWEAYSLDQLSRLLWSDPTLIRGRDDTLLYRLQINAQWYAWQAVQKTRQAWIEKARHPSHFRYVPVHPSHSTHSQ